MMSWQSMSRDELTSCFLLAGWCSVWLCIVGRRGTCSAPSLDCTAFILGEGTPGEPCSRLFPCPKNGTAHI